MLKLLVVGGGGREHAIIHSLRRSKHELQLWCAPGNAGIAQEAECLPIAADDRRALFAFVQANNVDLTIVGPEAALVEGLVDDIRQAGLGAIGPTKAAAQLEGSKSFAKAFMRKYAIPTAHAETVKSFAKGEAVLARWRGRCVVKADGLAAGKGVKVCANAGEAKEFLRDLMEGQVFGAAGAQAVLEECLEGSEATVMAFCDGRTLVPLPASQDHKRLQDDDRGPNTGGMGAYAPAPAVTPELLAVIEETIFAPFLRGIKAEKFDYRGIIYFGLMLTAKGPQVLEFNVRFGDPETQTVLPLLETDLLDIFRAVIERQLDRTPVHWSERSSLCVVAASRGYPGAFEKGKMIKGLESVSDADVQIYHAGTEQRGPSVVTAGGRVLGVSAQAPTLEQAQKCAYAALEKITFDGKTYRKDIGARALTGAVH